MGQTDTGRFPPIRLKGVKQNNLKNLSLEIPQRQITVITGLSGSGKSTLAFETLYAEGQRRYVESLSTYTRQFLEKMPKPELESIENIPPAIALEQRNTVLNSRSTVGTQSEMVDYLRLWFSKIGTLECQKCHATVREINSERIRSHLLSLGFGKKFALLSPLAFSSESKSKSSSFMQSYFSILSDQGFRRVYWAKQKLWANLDEAPPAGLTQESLLQGELYLLMDRFNFESIPRLETLDSDTRTRFVDSLELALRYGSERVTFLDLQALSLKTIQTGFACIECGERYPEPTPNLFSFNSPLGACAECNGFGFTLEIDEKKVIPSSRLTLAEGAIDPLSKPSAESEQRAFFRAAQKQGIRLSSTFSELSAPQKKMGVERSRKLLSGARRVQI
jgi:excinuclease ABC subunit A